MQTPTIQKHFLAVTLALLTASAANAALVNGGFEDPNLGGGWSLFSSIPGWNAVGTHMIEIGAGGIYGVTGFEGNQVMEMDSTGNAVVDQIVATPGGSYSLSFLYGLRSGVDPSSATFDVYWNGSLVTSVSPTSQVMSLYSTTLTALANNTLELRGTGVPDSLGGIVDDFQLTAVPEPSTYIAGALLLLPFGAQVVRRLRHK